MALLLVWSLLVLFVSLLLLLVLPLFVLLLVIVAVTVALIWERLFVSRLLYYGLRLLLL